MKGLLIKDLCLLRGQKRLLPMIALLAVWFTALFEDGFAFPFLGMMATILASSTVSYDELDRGQANLFALPFARGAYVTEKFLLTALLLAATTVLGFLCTFVRQMISHDVDMTSIWATIGITVLLCAVFAGVILPLRIRFSGDQGRVVVYAVMGVGMLAVVGLTRLLPKQAQAVSGFFSALPGPAVIAVAAGACLLFVGGGYALARHWIQKKEF